MYANSITGGCNLSPLMYCPATPVTRAQMSVFVVAALDLATGTALTFNPSPYYQDVPTGNTYFKFVQRIADLGITHGCQALPPLFCPDTTITHDQMAVFMIASWMQVHNLSTFTYTSTPYFSDVPATNPYFKFIQKMRDLNLWTGCGGGQYCPTSVVTRSDMAPLIMRSIMGTP